MYNVCEIRFWPTPPAKFNLYIFSCVTFCRKMHFYMHRHREIEGGRERESLLHNLFMISCQIRGEVADTAGRYVSGPGTSWKDQAKAVEISTRGTRLRGTPLFGTAKLFDLQCVNGHKNACIESEREKEKMRAKRREVGPESTR